MSFETDKDLRYLAGALEYRGSLEYMRIRFRSNRGKLPAQLKREFGGTLYQHCGVPYFEASGNAAYALLWRVLPHLEIWGKKARKLLTRWRISQKANKKGQK